LKLILSSGVVDDLSSLYLFDFVTQIKEDYFLVPSQGKALYRADDLQYFLFVWKMGCVEVKKKKFYLYRV
jgi:hypothetical protein